MLRMLRSGTWHGGGDIFRLYIRDKAPTDWRDMHQGTGIRISI